MLSYLRRLFARSNPQQGISYQVGARNGWTESPTRSGVQVTEATAYGLSAVWCAIRTISQDVGTLEPILYREDAKGSASVDDLHPLAPILSDSPNPEMTRPVFWETLQAHALLHGNGYAEIQRTKGGRPFALWPMHPQNTQVFRDQTSGRMFYRFYFTPSTATADHPIGSHQDFDAGDVLHVPGLSQEGTVGYRLLTLARESLGLGIATQRFGASYFGNGARPSATLETDFKLDDDSRENIRKSIVEMHSGPDNTGRIAVLEQGLKLTPWTMTNEQSQLTDLLKWYVYEVARLFNIPPSKLWSLEKATWGNLETLNRDYLNSCLRPWLEKWEAEIERKLLTDAERDIYYVEFDPSSLLRADESTRYASNLVACGRPFLTVNEVRARENLAPIDGGDALGSAPGIIPPQQTPGQQTTQQTNDTETEEIGEGA